MSELPCSVADLKTNVTNSLTYPTCHAPHASGVSGGGNSARVFEFCSGLVDLVVGVGHHLGGGHRLTLTGERFVGLLAEHIAQVGDGGAELGVCRRGQGTECETGDGGCRFEASEAVEEDCECSRRTIPLSPGHGGAAEGAAGRRPRNGYARVNCGVTRVWCSPTSSVRR